MNLVQAHGMLWRHHQANPSPPVAEIGGADVSVAYATAVASLSGALEDAESFEDLAAAVQLGETFLDAGGIGLEDVDAEVRRVCLAVVEEIDRRTGQTAQGQGRPLPAGPNFDPLLN